MDRKIYEELFSQNEILRKQNRNLDALLNQAERQTDLLKQQNQLLKNMLSDQTAILASIAGNLNGIPEMITAVVTLLKN